MHGFGEFHFSRHPASSVVSGASPRRETGVLNGHTAFRAAPTIDLHPAALR
jgi:hypothetical protein